ncbi:Maf family protein [Sandaracinus amylolyticus]|uniref:Maf family protein n=1 Tax=Sandaracinus amylolyticus TaxID=927083 RepID=UPI001F2E47DA|nr:Maf family protein [Sandaracinus amylolyticus]UJR79513.1 Septum formation inhibitor Maf [Sandaracinus amylolyticus]
MTLVLASASPRRREILTTLGVAFEVRPSNADETQREGEPARAYVQRVAAAKAVEIASACEAGRWVLGADTIVVVDGELLGKPESDAAARGMLRMLAGRWHEVITGVALARDGDVIETIAVTTRVAFRPLTVDMVERYVATGEGRDKAGAYGAQGIASGFVRGIEGSHSNVIGLPAAETIELLEKHGVIAPWPGSAR